MSQPELARLLRNDPQATAIDVGYGASHTTTVEWAGWLRRCNPGVRVVGLEIEPERVLPPRDGVEFQLGGFELAGMEATIIRAFNVLRQYDVAEVLDAWAMMCSRLRPGGVCIEGTCDELGRRSTWVLLDRSGPRSLTLAWSPHDVSRPSDVAERLPKALIHNNTPGHRIHEVLTRLDDHWDRAAGWEVFGPRARWRETLRCFLDDAGLPPQTASRRRLSDNTITLPWRMVADA